MTATITPDIAGFLQNVFLVKLTPSAETNADGDITNHVNVLRYNSMNDLPVDPNTGSLALGEPGVPNLDTAMKNIFESIGSENSALPLYFTKGKCRDTSIGGNDAVNCYPQFNETDDVSEHPFLSISGENKERSGMGRVYSEMYDDQQQIMYITFGVPQYNTMTNFYNNAISDNLAKLMNNGSGPNIGQLIGSTIGTFVSLPTLPMAFISNIIGLITNTKITKYYEFRSAMPLYYRCVNSMIIHLTVNLGLSSDAYLSSTSSQKAGGVISNLSRHEQAARSIQDNAGVSTQGLPDIFQNYGFDIYRILLKKYKYIENGFQISQQPTSDDMLDKAGGVDVAADRTTPTGKFASDFITMFTGQLYDANLFIGFRVEKGIDTSESFSNTTGESSISQQINQKARAAQDAKFSAMNGNVDGGVLSSIVGVLGGIVSGFTKATVGNTVENVMAGAGTIDFPEVWKDSTFSKSYHFNMSLRSPYGDPYSILQNLYIPLSMLLAGALPRGIGQSAYTSPFVCRAYCKGMFAVPLGMISNMTIKRGADQFGWTTSRLPTCIDVSFEIKDLSPTMFLAVGSGGTWDAIKEVFAANTTFQEYLMTLSGMGLADRITLFRNLRRKANYLLGQIQTSKLSKFYWGATFGNTMPARFITRFMPSTRIPNSN